MVLELVVSRSASQTPPTIRSIRTGIDSRTAASNARTVPIRSARSGITLNVVPACSDPTVTTTGSLGAISRLAIVCSMLTSCAAATIGSIDGAASRRGRPCRRDAITKTIRGCEERAVAHADLPASSPLYRCSANVRSTCGFSARLLRSSSCCRPGLLRPAENKRRASREFRRVRAAQLAAAEQNRHMAVVSACVHRAVARRAIRDVVDLCIGSASISARSSVTGPGFRP